GARLWQARILMAAHVIPRPSEEATFLDRSDVVGDEMVAQIVALIGGAPELTCSRIDCLANAVADAVGIDFDELAVRRVLQPIGAGELFRMRVRVGRVRARPHGDKQVLTVFRKDYVASPVTSARELGVSG